MLSFLENPFPFVTETTVITFSIGRKIDFILRNDFLFCKNVMNAQHLREIFLLVRS